MEIRNPCDHIKEMIHYNTIRVHIDNETCWLKLQRFDDCNILDYNVVKYCPMCGEKIDIL